jgi:hypothetical protein
MGARGYLEVATVIDALAIQPLGHQQVDAFALEVDPGHVRVGGWQRRGAGAQEQQAGKQEGLAHQGASVRRLWGCSSITQSGRDFAVG